MFEGTSDLNPLRLNNNQDVNPQPIRGEPDEPLPRSSSISSSFGDNTSSKKDDILDMQDLIQKVMMI